jgi:hypothetical protein
MKALYALLFIFCLSCSDIQQLDIPSQGDMITLNDGRRVVVDAIIPGGFIVYVPNKYAIQPFQVTISQIKK